MKSIRERFDDNETEIKAPNFLEIFYSILGTGTKSIKKYLNFSDMNEKIYKTMSSTGACSLTVGIIVLATGIVTGIMMIVNGARLLKKKSEILI